MTEEEAKSKNCPLIIGQLTIAATSLALAGQDGFVDIMSNSNCSASECALWKVTEVHPNHDKNGRCGLIN